MTTLARADALFAELDAALRANARPETDPVFLARYLGRERPALGLRVGTVRTIARHAIKTHKDFACEEWVAVLDALYAGEYYDHRLLAGMVLAGNPSVRSALPMPTLEAWLANLRGWAEIDGSCQSTWTGAEMLAHWDAWQPFFDSTARSENISLRRASLVLLCKPVRTGSDVRLRDQAFAQVDLLKYERVGLITKAVSWLLRELTAHHASDVSAYIEANRATLPAIAVRETRNKLATGRK